MSVKDQWLKYFLVNKSYKPIHSGCLKWDLDGSKSNGPKTQTMNGEETRAKQLLRDQEFLMRATAESSTQLC